MLAAAQSLSRPPAVPTGPRPSATEIARRRRRGVSLVTALGLTLVSAAAVTVSQLTNLPTALAGEMPSGVPVAVPAPSLPPKTSYVIGQDIDSDLTTISDKIITAKDFLAQPKFASLLENSADGGSAFSSFPGRPAPTVLKGDNVTFVGAFWNQMASAAVVGAGGTWVDSPEGNWVPQSQYFKVRDGAKSSLETVKTDFSEWPTTCAAPGTADWGSNLDPVADPAVIWNAWCISGPAGLPAVFKTTITNIQTPVAGSSSAQSALWRAFNFVFDNDEDPRSAVRFSGPNNNRTGSVDTTYAQVAVVNPALTVVKEVCSDPTQTAAACDINTDPATLNPDGTYKENGGLWVKDQLIPQGSSTVQWRITAINTGNIGLTNVHTAKDTWGYSNPADQGKADSSSCESLTFGDIAAGASKPMACSSALTGKLVGSLVNGINLNGGLAPQQWKDPATAANPNPPTQESPTIAPDGTDLAGRLRGNPEGTSTDLTVGMVGSNTDVAQIQEPQPRLKLTKWVCDKGTGCADPSGAVLTKLAGIGAKQADGSYAVTQGQPAGGWVKATTVTYNTAADWLVIVTNTGNTFMQDVSLTKEQAAGFGGTLSAVTPASVATLAPGQSGLFHVNSSNVTDTHTMATGDDGKTANPYGEPAYNTGQAVVNTAQAQGTPTLDSAGAKPVLGTNGQAVPPLPSNASTAQVNTAISAKIDLTKWVCKQGTGCATPTGATLTNVASLNAAGWVKETTVPYDTAAQWLIIVTNTGNVALSNVKLTQEFLTGDGHGAMTGCQVGDVVAANLAAGASAAVTCTTAEITNTNPWVRGKAVGEDVVNTAQAQGTPVDGSGKTLPKPNGDTGTIAPIDSPRDNAEVNTKLPGPAIDLTKWVCKAGTGCTVPTGATLSDLANGKAAGGWVKETTVPYNTTAQWLIVITNTGDTILADVTLTMEELSGVGHGAMTGCAAGDVVATTLKPNESATVSCTTAAITNTNDYVVGPDTGKDVVNTAAASGKPVDDKGKPIPKSDGSEWPPIDSPQDKAEVNTITPAPGLDLTKWVCQTGTGCADPSAADLAKLAAGEAAGGWVKETTVPYNTDAQWLIVVTNTGNVALADVTLTTEFLSGLGHGDLTGCAVGDVLAALLKPGQSATRQCLTAAITNTNDFVVGKATGDDVVNTAAASGKPVDDKGKPIPKPNGETGVVPPIDSKKDTAEANTVTPVPHVTIKKYDTLNGDDLKTGDFNTTAKMLKPDEATPIELLVTNDGTEDLVDIAVTDATVAGTGKVTGLTCDFSPLGGPDSGTTWAGPFLVGDSFTCKGTLAGLGSGAKHTDRATVNAKGSQTGSKVKSTDDWNGNTPTPAPPIPPSGPEVIGGGAPATTALADAQAARLTLSIRGASAAGLIALAGTVLGVLGVRRRFDTA